MRCAPIWLKHTIKADIAANISTIRKNSSSAFQTRRRAVGWALYGLLGIGKGDFEKTQAQHARNFTFFDAPVGLIFTINRGLEIGSWLDFGMFMQNVMVLARSHGLETCPQAAFATFHTVIRKHLPLGDEDVVVAGMALGKAADWSKAENTLITERMALKDYVRFHRQLTAPFIENRKIPGETVMDFQLTRQQRALQETARSFARQEMTEVARTLEETDEALPREHIKRYAEMGFLGINVAEKYGGLGLGNLEALIVLEEFAKGFSGGCVSDIRVLRRALPCS